MILVNIYAANIKHLIYKANITEQKGKYQYNNIKKLQNPIFNNGYYPHRKYMLDQMSPTDIYRRFHLKQQNTFFLSTQGKFFKIDHRVRHKQVLIHLRGLG